MGEAESLEAGGGHLKDRGSPGPLGWCLLVLCCFHVPSSLAPFQGSSQPLCTP